MDNRSITDKRARATVVYTLTLAVLMLVCTPATAAEPIVAARSDDIPAQPARIVTLDDLSTELVLSLGLAPVGVANLDGYRQWVEIDAERLEEAQALGTAQQPDLEAIVRLQPDLVVGMSYLHGSLFKRLDALAPTLIYRHALGDGERDAIDAGLAMLRHLAALTGRRAQAAEAIETMHTALDNAGAAARQAGVAEKPLAVLYPLTDKGAFIASNEQTLVVSLANRLGGPNPWPLRKAGRLHRRLGMRPVAERTDLSVLFIGSEPGDPFFDSALWRALPVARQGRYGFIDSPYWSYGGPRSVAKLAEQMADAFEKMPRAPSP